MRASVAVGGQKGLTHHCVTPVFKADARAKLRDCYSLPSIVR